VLIFLFPRYASNQLNGVLFRVTLTTTLLTIFLFGISGVYYLEVVGTAKTSIARKRVLVQRGDSLFVVSLMLGTAMPALILFTLGVTDVARDSHLSMGSLRWLHHTTRSKTAHRLRKSGSQGEDQTKRFTAFHQRLGRMVACISTLTKRASEYFLCVCEFLRRASKRLAAQVALSQLVDLLPPRLRWKGALQELLPYMW